MKDQNFKSVIGLEIHIELATKSKMFCGCQADHFGKRPNTQTCPVCLGLPGALPVPNKKAIDWTVLLGLALNSRVNRESRFDRKHYFYPDLAKGYQISQYEQPFTYTGNWTGLSGNKIVIRRVHLEEDTGKLQHTILDGEKVSLVDFNRSGVPLIELVTEPDFDNPSQVDEFVRDIQLIVRYLGISDCDMDKGSMRLEANVSLLAQNPKSKILNSKLPDYKVELKNINSFRFLQKAIEAEIERQKEILESGGKVIQETRGYDENTGKTFSQRVKEEAQDYRYFPEPDIPPIRISDKDVKILSDSIPEMPDDLRKRFREKYSLKDSYIEILLEDKNRASYFEEVVSVGKKYGVGTLLAADMMVNKGLDKGFPEASGLVKKIIELTKSKDVKEEEIESVGERVLKETPKAVSDFKSGKVQVVGYLIGLVQKKLGGKADPKLVRDVLMKKLKSV